MSQPPSKRSKADTSAYVSGLPLDIGQFACEDVFKRFGKLRSVKIYRNKDGSAKGDALVVFSRPEGRDAAIKHLNNTDTRIGYKNIRLKVEVASWGKSKSSPAKLAQTAAPDVPYVAGHYGPPVAGNCSQTTTVGSTDFQCTDPSQFSVKDLKGQLAARGISSAGCLSKSDLLEKLQAGTDAALLQSKVAVDQPSPSTAEVAEESREPASAKKKASEHKAAGNSALRAGELDKAVAEYTSAIALDPSNHIFFSNRSAALLQKGNVAEAVADAERCVDLNPKWAKGYGRLGAALYKKNAFAEAARAYSRGLERDATNIALQQGLRAAKCGLDKAAAAVESCADDDKKAMLKRKRAEESVGEPAQESRSISSLKSQIRALGGTFEGCFERRDLEERLRRCREKKQGGPTLQSSSCAERKCE